MLCRLKCPRFGPRRDGPDWLVRLRAVLDRKRHVCQRCAGFFARRSLTMNDGEGTALAAPFLPVPVCCNVSRMPDWIPIAVLFAAATASLAQAPRSTVVGRVTDATGLALSG